MLDELRRRFLSEHRAPARAARAVDRLSLEDLDVAEFSQVVADAFAGDTWFDALEALDGERPNINHQVLAELAKQGRLQVVLTTNFDTLAERAMRAVGVSVGVWDALVDSPPTVAASADEVLVVKLHGTASRRSTLVDLGSQRRRGLPIDWQDWLQTALNGAELLVGFSGADLAIRPDYLRLEAAAPDIVSMRWLASSPPNEQVDGLLRLDATRFSLVTGHLPNAWTSLGVDHDVVARAVARLDAPKPASATGDPIPAVGRRWLDARSRTRGTGRAAAEPLAVACFDRTPARPDRPCVRGYALPGGCRRERATLPPAISAAGATDSPPSPHPCIGQCWTALADNGRSLDE